ETCRAARHSLLDSVELESRAEYYRSHSGAVEGFTLRRLLFVAFVPLVLVAIAPAAPIPKHLMQVPVYYYPTTVGARWVYEQPSGELVLVVSKVENRQGMTVVSIESVEGRERFPFETVEVSPTGLVRTSCPAGELDTPSVLLKTPFKPRDSWDF